MSLDTVLSRLHKVKRTGSGSFMACCPAHEDKTPSMTIKETSDGRILIHCFSGCSISEILGSIGVSIDELFPERLPDTKRERTPWNPSDILAAISYELTVILIAASDVQRGKKLNDEDSSRFRKAMERVQTAIGMANGH